LGFDADEFFCRRRDLESNSQAFEREGPFNFVLLRMTLQDPRQDSAADLSDVRRAWLQRDVRQPNVAMRERTQGALGT